MIDLQFEPGADAAANWGAPAALRTAVEGGLERALARSPTRARRRRRRARAARRASYDLETDRTIRARARRRAGVVVDETRAARGRVVDAARAPAGPTAAQRRLAPPCRPHGPQAPELFLAPWIDEPLDALPPPPNASLVSFLHSDAAPAKLPLPDLHLGCYYTDAGEIAERS